MLDSRENRRVTCIIDKVLESLEANLADHLEPYEEAMRGYKKECQVLMVRAIEDMQDRLNAAEQGNMPDMSPVNLTLHQPESHEEEFRQVITMLTFHKEAHEAQPGGVEEHGPATIDLNAKDIQRYVRNKWEWSRQWVLMNAAYSGKAHTEATSMGYM